MSSILTTRDRLELVHPRPIYQRRTPEKYRTSNIVNRTVKFRGRLGLYSCALLVGSRSPGEGRGYRALADKYQCSPLAIYGMGYSRHQTCVHYPAVLQVVCRTPQRCVCSTYQNEIPVDSRPSEPTPSPNLIRSKQPPSDPAHPHCQDPSKTWLKPCRLIQAHCSAFIPTSKGEFGLASSLFPFCSRATTQLLIIEDVGSSTPVIIPTSLSSAARTPSISTRPFCAVSPNGS